LIHIAREDKDIRRILHSVISLASKKRVDRINAWISQNKDKGSSGIHDALKLLLDDDIALRAKHIIASQQDISHITDDAFMIYIYSAAAVLFLLYALYGAIFPEPQKNLREDVHRVLNKHKNQDAVPPTK
jgi:hypothetical protein